MHKGLNRKDPPRMFLALILSITFVATVIACGGQPEQKEFRIGLIAPITGNIPTTGRAAVDGATLAVKEVNDGGGLEIAGQAYQVVLVIEDNQDKAEVSVQAALKLVNQQNVIAIVGPYASRNAIPTSTVAERTKIPMISPSSTNPATTLNKTWVFRATFIDPFQGQVMAQFAWEELDAQKVAVLYDIASEYNRGLAEFFRSSYEGYGGEMVAFESYTTDAPDVTQQMARIKESEADVLFLPNYYNEVLQQVGQAREMGIKAQIIGGDTWSSIQGADRSAVEGSYFSTHYAVDVADEKAQGFVTRFQEAYGRDPEDNAALTYDSFGLLFKAVKDQGKVDPDAIRDGLAAIVYRGVTGTIEYGIGSGDPLKSAVIMEIKDGNFVFHSRAEP